MRFSPSAPWTEAAARGTAAQRETRLVAALLLVFAAVWIGHLGLSNLVPPVDDLEQLTWAHALQWGYYKHPPLPTWLIWGPEQLFGPTRWTVYTMGAATTGASLAIFWWLLRRLRGEVHAFVALLAVLCITYYNGRLDYYNHDIVLLLASTACAALVWQAAATGQARWWAAVGLGFGLGALAKYQIAVTATAAAVFFVQQGLWREARQRRGAALAAAVALLTVLPHLLWLLRHDFAPVHYAVGSSLGAGLGAASRSFDALHWLADQIGNRSGPAWLLLAGAALLARRLPPGRRRPHDAARALLLAWGLVPLAFMPLTGVLLGADLQLHWGTPFLPFAVAAAMELAAPRAGWAAVPRLRLLQLFVLLQALLLLQSWMGSAGGPDAMRQAHWRNFDAGELATRIAPEARRALGGPVRLIVGPPALAGALAEAMAEHPLVLIDGRLDRSPWVPPDLAARCGALDVGPGLDGPDTQDAGPGFETLRWRTRPAQAGAGGCPPP